jgi:hypothetical protein
MCRAWGMRQCLQMSTSPPVPNLSCKDRKLVASKQRSASFFDPFEDSTKPSPALCGIIGDAVSPVDCKLSHPSSHVDLIKALECFTVKSGDLPEVVEPPEVPPISICRASVDGPIRIRRTPELAGTTSCGTSQRGSSTPTSCLFAVASDSNALPGDETIWHHLPSENRNIDAETGCTAASRHSSDCSRHTGPLTPDTHNFPLIARHLEGLPSDVVSSDSKPTLGERMPGQRSSLHDSALSPAVGRLARLRLDSSISPFMGPSPLPGLPSGQSH